MERGTTQWRHRRRLSTLCFFFAFLLLCQACTPALTVGTDAAAHAVQEALAYPAQQLEGELNGLSVVAESPRGALPRGTRMVLSAVPEAEAQAAASMVKTPAASVSAVDIAFYSQEGQELEPLLPVRVSIGGVPSGNRNRVLHVADDGEVSLLRHEDRGARGLAFTTDAFSTFVIVELVETKVITADGDVYHVSVNYDTRAQIPEGATLSAVEIPADSPQYEQYYADIASHIDPQTEVIKGAKLFDITILSEDGQEVQPAVPVQVSIVLEEEQEGTPQVLHLSEQEEEPQNMDATLTEEGITFTADGFSVYAVVYTVDFAWEVDGQTYGYTLQGGGYVPLIDLLLALNVVTEENRDRFYADIVDVAFSAPELLWVGKAAADTTVGALKEAQGLDVEYTDAMLPEEIEALNAQAVPADQWGLISLHPFDTEETLTVTLRTGEVFTLQVTDAHEIADAEATTIDVNKSYLICYQVGNTYYLLKNDGTVDSGYHPNFAGDADSAHDFEHLNSTYAWTFNHIFKEMDVAHGLNKNYYLIRPIDNKAKTIALNEPTSATNPLVQQGNNNTAVIQVEGGGFRLEGYHNIGTEDDPQYYHLGFESGGFCAVTGENVTGVTVHIYEMDELPTYDYTVRSADEIRGTVSVAGGSLQAITHEGVVVAHYYDATSTSTNKTNAGAITATPVTHTDTAGYNKWLFDHWELDGIPLDRDQYPATIPANTLTIPHNGTRLVAYFKQNPDYTVPDSEKEPSSIDNLQEWMNKLTNEEIHVPLDESATKKTAEVYDYENRIYRVDLTSKANFQTFKGNLDLAFCLDVSNSMYFPSKLIETTTSNYSSGDPNIPIYQINWSDSNYNNRNWLNTSRGWNNPYYLVADESNTATVFKVYYQGGNWKAQDASRETEDDKSFIIGQELETSWTSSAADKTHPFGLGDNNNTSYTIYDAGDDGRNRFYYLNQSFAGGTNDLNTIAQLLKVAGEASPNVRVAFNTFNKNLGSQRIDFGKIQDLPQNLDLSNSHGGGTRPDQAFNDAQSFDWQSTERYVVLVTDGAPQGKRDGESGTIDFVQVAKDAARDLQNICNVKFITIGLSLDKVTSGKRLLYDLADVDRNGNKMFYLAESASDLSGIFRQITKTLVEDAIVYGNISDTVGEAFYLVDKATGMPLQPGNWLDIEGKLTTDPSKKAGEVQTDGRTVVWTDQAFDSAVGWHGTLYVKAQEDLLCGNAVDTNVNTESGKATITATRYNVDGNLVNFVNTDLVRKLRIETKLPSPKVNVNELSFPRDTTQWTVYLGTEVEPGKQLKALYEGVLVGEVVNGDGSLHYTLSPNDISDDREDGQEQGTKATFPLAPVILDRLVQEGTQAQKDRYLIQAAGQPAVLNWDTFLADIQTSGGVAVPYHPYGIQGEDSNIVIKLEKTAAADVSNHATQVMGEAVETYTLTVKYNPDYTHVLPAGQGGNSTEDFHTGTYGTMYQGHAAGRETYTGVHTVNVYSVPLEVYKVDESNVALPGATFKLYKADATNGTAVPGLTGNYVEVASGTSGSNGIARLQASGADFELVTGETYYLVETAAPETYQKDDTAWAVQVQPEVGTFKDLSGNTLYSHPAGSATTPIVSDDMYPFNWDQGVRLVLNGTPVTVIAKGNTEGTTTVITGGAFVPHDRALSFRHTVRNRKEAISITVNKTWDDRGINRPSSVTVKLYRVSEKGHQWTSQIVPCTCTDAGVIHYTCALCGATKADVAISAAGHTPGTAHRENEVAPTCTAAGGYDTVTRCTVCNAIISSVHTTIPALGHVPGAAQDEVLSTYAQGHCYDTVTRCTRCGAVISSVAHDHTWGDWQVTTPAQPGVAGEETRTCSHRHVETQPISALPLQHTVTIYIRCIGNGSGQVDFSGQITSLAERSGTGIGDMTIQWDWNQWTQEQPFDVDGLVGGAYETHSWSTDGVNFQNDGSNRGGRETLTIHDITQDLVIYVTIRNGGWTGTDNSLIYQPTFSGTRRSAQSPRRTKAMSKAPALTSSGTTLNDPRTYLDTIPVKTTATCGEFYNELAGEYTFTGTGDSWTKLIDNLPKYNEYGHEYRYYVVETSPSSGYDVAYSDQTNGLANNGVATITNTKHFGSLLITKNVLYNGNPAATAAEKALVNGTYTFAVKKDGTEISGSPFSITVSDGVTNKLLIQNLEPGDYTIEETAPTGFTVTPSGGASVSGNVVTVTVTADKETEAQLQDDAKAAFTNNCTAYQDFTFTKVWRDAVGRSNMSWPAGQSITVKILQNDTLYATYTIGASDLVVGTQIAATEDSTKPKLTVTAADPSTGYTFKLVGLPSGIVYYVMENETVTGYQPPKYFNEAGTKVEGNQIGDNGSIKNDLVGYELPKTGGTGTGGIRTAGAGLVLMALAGLTAAGLKRRRRRSI